MIIPNDIAKKGVAIEFKTVRNDDAQALEDKVQEALAQIAGMNYTDELMSCGIKEVVELAIVFCGKNVHLSYNNRNLYIR